MNNKKGAELAIGTIIMIILGLVVLVVVIYGFTVGWGNVIDKLSGITGGKVNVPSVIQGCELSCSVGSTYDYCTRERKVIFEEGKDSEAMTCRTLSLRGVGLEPCDAISCPKPGVKCEDLAESECKEDSNCEVSLEGVRTVERWIREDVGVGKTYKSVDVIDGKVTDLEQKETLLSSDLSVAERRNCVKLVRN